MTAYFLCFGAFPFCSDAPSREGMTRAILLGQCGRPVRGGGAAAFTERQLERRKSARCTVDIALFRTVSSLRHGGASKMPLTVF